MNAPPSPGKGKGKKKTRGLGSVAFCGMCGAEGESPTKKKLKKEKLTHPTKKVAVASRGALRAFAADAF